MAAQSASRHQGRNRWVETGGAAGGEAREDEERGQQGRAGVGTCLVALALCRCRGGGSTAGAWRDPQPPMPPPSPGQAV